MLCNTKGLVWFRGISGDCHPPKRLARFDFGGQIPPSIEGGFPPKRRSGVREGLK